MDLGKDTADSIIWSVEIKLGLKAVSQVCELCVFKWTCWIGWSDPWHSAADRRAQTAQWQSNRSRTKLNHKKAHYVLWNTNLAADHWPVYKSKKEKKQTRKHNNSLSWHSEKVEVVGGRCRSVWMYSCANRKTEIGNQSTKCMRLLLLRHSSPLLSILRRQWWGRRENY